MSANQPNTTRVITVRLRIPALVIMTLILIGGLVWAFILGIMVGRGQITDELAALMPPPQSAPQNEADKAADEVEKLIKAEDLKYQDSLRQNPPPAPARPLADPAAQAAAARRDSAPEAQTQVQTQAQAANRAEAGSAGYRYSYQVASYNKEEQARELAARLSAKGVKGEVEVKTVDGTARFRVLISFEGNEDSVKSVQNMLKKDFNINGILPRGKTPLGG